MKQAGTRELQRLYFLQELGISSWFPRQQLPGARASVLLDLEVLELIRTTTGVQPRSGTEQVDQRQVAATRIPEAVAPSSHGHQARQRPGRALDVPQQSAGPAARIPAPPARLQHPEQAGNALVFQWLFYPLDEQLALLCHQPAVQSTGMNRQETVLLRNILAWLGRPDFAGVSPRPFRWPLPGISRTDTATAGSSLLAFLQQLLLEHPFTNLLVMGETLLDTLQLDLSRQGGEWQCHVTASLPEMLKLPGLKREAWQRLQPLQSRLSGIST